MAYRLDVVAVGIEHEGAVVIRVVVRPQPRRAVILAAGGERRTVEGVDRCAIIGGDRDVQDALNPALATDPEIRIAVAPETGGGTSALGFRDLHDHAVAERRQRLLVEGRGARGL